MVFAVLHPQALTAVVANTFVRHMHPRIVGFINYLIVREPQFYYHSRKSLVLQLAASVYVCGLSCEVLTIPNSTNNTVEFFIPLPAADVDWLAIKQSQRVEHRADKGNQIVLYFAAGTVPYTFFYGSVALYQLGYGKVFHALNPVRSKNS